MNRTKSSQLSTKIRKSMEEGYPTQFEMEDWKRHAREMEQLVREQKQQLLAMQEELREYRQLVLFASVPKKRAVNH